MHSEIETKHFFMHPYNSLTTPTGKKNDGRISESFPQKMRNWTSHSNIKKSVLFEHHDRDVPTIRDPWSWGATIPSILEKENLGTIWYTNTDVSKKSGTPKSSILIGVSIINHAFWGTTILGNPHGWNIPIFNRKYIFNLGPFSIAM